MLKLIRDRLEFSFPQVHPDARMSLDFQRTLRIPDDGDTHWLPPGLGSFPLKHVDDYASRVPFEWRERGGVMLPMFQSEAMWISFSAHNGYPMLVKIAAGKINAVTGEGWDLTPHPEPQDYLVLPGQPWLDGFAVKKGVIRQFVAMPLGEGYTVEEQVTGEAEFGGVQIVVYPLKKEKWEAILKEREEERKRREEEWERWKAENPDGDFPGPRGVLQEPRALFLCRASQPDMGLGMGGRMRQQIHADGFDFENWDLDHMARCYVHIANSMTWRAITGEAPPTIPPTAKQYAKAGLPWFDHYCPDAEVLPGSAVLDGVQSVLEYGAGKGETPLPENESLGVDGVPVKDLSGLTGIHGD